MPCLTAVKVPNGIDWKKLINSLLDKNIEISGGLGATLGKIWRIGTFGLNSNQKLISHITNELKIAIEEQKNL